MQLAISPFFFCSRHTDLIPLFKTISRLHFSLTQMGINRRIMVVMLHDDRFSITLDGTRNKHLTVCRSDDRQALPCRYGDAVRIRSIGLNAESRYDTAPDGPDEALPVKSQQLRFAFTDVRGGFLFRSAFSC